MKSQADKSARTIILNGRKRTLDCTQLSYNELVMLTDGPVGTEDNRVFTMTYFRGPASNREGSLSRGQVVKLKNRMVFTVVQTNRA